MSVGNRDMYLSFCEFLSCLSRQFGVTFSGAVDWLICTHTYSRKDIEKKKFKMPTRANCTLESHPFAFHWFQNSVLTYSVCDAL